MPDNPYLNTARGMPGGKSDNPYLETAQGVQQDQESSLRQSFLGASAVNPDEKANTLRLAADVKVHPNLVESDPKTFQENKYLNDALRLRSTHPKTAEWLQNPDNAAIGRDDLDGLSKIESTVQDHSYLDSVMRDLGHAAASFNATIANAPAFINDLANYPVNVGLKAVGSDYRFKTPDALKNNFIAKYWEDQAAALAHPDLNESAVTELWQGNFSRVGRILAHQFVSNAPNHALIVAGALSGYGLPALIAVGGQQAINVNAANKDADEIDRVGNAIMQGTVEAAFESLGTFGIVKKWSGAIAKNFGKATSKEVMKDFAKTLSYSFAAEGNEEFWTSAAQDFSDYITDVNPDALKGMWTRALDAGLAGGVFGLTMTGPSAIGAGVARGKQAQLQRDFYLSMGESTQATKARQRLPEAQRQLVDALTKGSSVENIYIPVEAMETYFQSKNVTPATAMQEIGATEAYNEAKETGSDVKIPLAVWVDKVGSTEHYAALQNDVRFTPDGLSVNELKAEQEQVKAEAENVSRETSPIESEIEQIRSETKEQLLQTGQYSNFEAEQYAELNASFFRTQATRENLSPLELKNKYGLTFTSGREAAQGGQVLNQSANLAPAFYSKLQKTVEEKLGNSATTEQVNAVLRDTKEEEREWSGIDEFLKGKQKVSKDELLNFLRGNQLQIKEVVKGDTAAASAEERRAQLESIPEDQRTLRQQNELGDLIDGNWTGAPTRPEFNTETKFSRYTLPGGENYREVLFTLPERSAELSLPSGYQFKKTKKGIKVVDENGEVVGEGATEQDAIRDSFTTDRLEELGQNYRSSHFDEPNILAHVRLNDRVDAEGKKVLFVEEIQSDWHQEGRKKGYKSKETRPRNIVEKELNAYEKELLAKYRDKAKPDINNKIGLGEIAPFVTPEEEAHRAKLVREFNENAGSGTVPDAPFKKTWHEFVLKRMIREAAEKGYDKIAWTTGEQQAERYDLSKQVDKITAHKAGDKFDVVIYKDGRQVDSKEDLSPDQIESYVGKDLAAKIVADAEASKRKKNFSYSGVDLKVGGEGMKGFYDKILVDAANKLTKKFGGKVGETKISEAMNPDRISAAGSTDKGTWAGTDYGYEATLPDGTTKEFTSEAFGSDEAAKIAMFNWLKGGGFVKVHALEITSSIKEAALKEGFPLFQGDPNAPRGQIRIGPNRFINIDIFKSSDRSTPIHELAHGYLEILGDLAFKEGATQKIKDDYQATLDWLGIKDRSEITREHHEKWAEAFETYTMKGKAPSQSLRKTFVAFKVWLLNIYRSIQGRVAVSKEIKGVFDRMLATEEEIAAAEVQQNMEPLFIDLVAAGMSEAEAKRYIEARDEARTASEEELQKKVMEPILREQRAEYRDKRKEVRAQVEVEVSNTNLYKAIDRLQSDEKLPGAGEFKLNRAELVQKYGKDFVKKLPRKILSKEGVSLELAAELLSFESGDSLIIQIANAPKKSEAIEKQTDQKMGELYPDVLTSGALKNEAMKAVHTEKRAELLRLELQHLASNNLAVVKNIARKLIRRVPTEKAVREQAVKIIGARKLSELKPYLFERAERKAAKEAGDLFAKGDIEGAFEAKRRELLNHELYRTTVAAQEAMDSARERFKKLSRKDEDLAKSRDMNLIAAARSLLAQHGLGKFEEKASNYLDKLKSYEPDTYESVQSLISSIEGNPKPLKDLTFNEFSDLINSVDALWALAKSQKQIEIDGRKLDKEIAIEELMKGAGGIPPSDYASKSEKWRKSLLMLQGARASLRRVEAWVDAMDKGKVSGPFHTYIFNPIKEAINGYRVRKIEVIAKYRELLKSIEKTLTTEKIQATELGGSKTYFNGKVELLGALLHTGNLSNKQKLLRGYGWASVDESGNVDTSRWDQFIKRMIAQNVLTKADYDFLQGVWDLNESLKPEAQKAHKAMYGYLFNEITAEVIQTPFGEYRGGYVPAVVDATLSSDAQVRQDKEILEKFNNSFMFPTTGRGFTKSRVESYAAPLVLDLRLIGGHLDKVLRFIHIEPRVKEVGRILIDKNFRGQLDQIDQTIVSDMLMPWLQRSAQQRITTPTQAWGGKFIDTFAREVRRRTGLNIMAGNVVNTLQQITGLSIAALKVKPKYLRNGLWQFVRQPKATAEGIIEKSDFMKTRVATQVFDIQHDIDEILLNPSKFETALQFATKHGYVLQQIAQNTVDNIAWAGAYEQAIENGATEKEAVREADSAVRLTQGSFDAEDISRFETGSPFIRAFTMFYSYFNMQANLLGTEFVRTSREMGLRKGAGRALYIYTLGFMIPALLSELLVKAASGKFDDDDDDEYLDDFLAVFFGSQQRTATAMVPVAGPIANRAFNAFNDKWYDDRISTSPAIAAIESASGAPKSVYEAIAGDGSKKKAVRDSLTALGLLTGLPVAPLSRPIGYLSDVSEGKAEPENALDFARGLLTGKSGMK